jgi:hypothetical protein
VEEVRKMYETLSNSRRVKIQLIAKKENNLSERGWPLRTRMAAEN